MEEVTSPRRVAHLHASGCHGPAELGGSEPAAANLDDLAERARSEDGFSVNFERPVLGCIIRIRSRSVFEKKGNLGVCAKQKVRLTRLGKYYVVQYYTLYMEENPF